MFFNLKVTLDVTPFFQQTQSLPWYNSSYTFIANDVQTKIYFEAIGPAVPYGILLDNVVVTESAVTTGQITSGDITTSRVTSGEVTSSQVTTNQPPLVTTGALVNVPMTSGGGGTSLSSAFVLTFELRLSPKIFLTLETRCSM